MPVMVTGVDNPVGARAVRLLTAQAGEVRVFVQATPGEDVAGQSIVQTMRGLGCKVAHGHLDDEAHVETAMEQVHTVAHLLGRPPDDPGTFLEQTATVIGAAIGAGCRRLVLLSDLAVMHPALRGNEWVQALVEAEEMAADAPLESVVLRCAVIHGPADVLTTGIAAGALGEDPPGAHWPVAASDVATTAVLADAERDVDSSLHVEVALAGPRRVTTAAYAEALRAIVPAASGDPLPVHAVELLLTTIDPPEDALGRGGRSVEDGYA